MPLTRKYKKRTTRRTRRRFNITRKAYIRRNAKVNHLSTKRFIVGKYGANGSDTLSSLSVSQTFALNDLPGHTEFQALFDQYQIKGVQYRFRIQRDPSVNSSTAVANQGIFPRVYWAHDHDDSGSSFTLADIVQYPRMREISFTANRDCTRWMYLKPAVAAQMFGTVYTGYSAKWRQWLDCAYPGTPHYGLKFHFANLYSGMQLYLDCKYILKFKSVI